MTRASISLIVGRVDQAERRSVLRIGDSFADGLSEPDHREMLLLHLSRRRSRSVVGRMGGIFAVVLLLGTVLPALAAGREPGLLIRDGDLVVFYGDSITDTEWYPTLVETYVRTRHPTWRVRFSNRGVSGDHSGSISRFGRDVIAQKPDVLIYNMGFNDGGYGKLTSGRLELWLANIEESVRLAREANARMRILLASPIPNEPTVSQDPRWVSHPAYPYTMLMFGREQEMLARRLGVDFVDTGIEYGRTMGLGRVVGGEAFALSRDGVHPQQEGQAFLAFHLLRGLGANPALAEVVIDGDHGRLLRVDGCRVTELELRDGRLSFRRIANALPWPVPAVARPWAFLVRLDDELNLDRLVVEGLPAPSYRLLIDGRPVAEVAAAELADGLNLSRFPATPMNAQALAVLDAVRQLNLLEVGYWRRFIVPGQADGAGDPVATADEAARAEMEKAREGIQEATTACTALCVPRPHTITLEPSTNQVARFAALERSDWNQAQLQVTVPAVPVDWNTMTLAAEEFLVNLQNPGAGPKAGALRWSAGAGWKITPAEVWFQGEPGQSGEVRFSISCSPGTPLLPPPSLTVRWPWTADWAYPVTFERELSYQPVLTIAPAKAKVTLDGDLGDWRDATAFTLADERYVDPAVPGKKRLWNGPSDLSAQFFLKWDADALYLAALVRDSEHIQNQSERMMWSQDLLHVALALQEPGQPEGRFEFGFGAYADRDAVAKYMNSAQDATGPDLQFKSRVDRAQGTCVYEVLIPWSRLAPFTPADGKRFRFTLAVGDADAQPGKGFNYLAWTPGINYGKYPADFAVIVLGGR